MRRAEKYRGLLLAATVILPVAVCNVAAVAQERTDLKRLEGELESTRARGSSLDRTSKELAVDLATLRQQSIEAARAAQESESKLTGLEQRIQSLEKQAVAHQTSLRAGRRHAARDLAGP